MAQNTLPHLRQGALAGALAGLIQVALLFVDSGPGNALSLLARWLGSDTGTGGKTLGALLFILFGALGGLLFAQVTRNRPLPLPVALRLGLIAGAIWWVVVAGVSLVRHQPLAPFSLIYFLVLGLLYGLLVGNFMVTLSRRGSL